MNGMYEWTVKYQQRHESNLNAFKKHFKIHCFHNIRNTYATENTIESTVSAMSATLTQQKHYIIHGFRNIRNTHTTETL